MAVSGTLAKFVLTPLISQPQDIANATGYSDPSHFVRAFQHVYGVMLKNIINGIILSNLFNQSFQSIIFIC